MDCYEELVDYAEQHGLEVIEKEFKSSAKGLCKGKKIGISKKIDSTVEKRCVLYVYFACITYKFLALFSYSYIQF